MLILAGDIGGTNTSLLLSEHSNSSLQIIHKCIYSSKDYTDFYHILRDFLEKSSREHVPIKAACFAIAGPVQNNEVHVTNLPWVINESSLKNKFDIEVVKLINDFQAVGYGIEKLDINDLITLQSGKPDAKGSKLLIGAGTGLGIGILFINETGINIMPSEGGNADFAPRNDLDIQLLQFLMQYKKRISCEEILSGNGLKRIYDFIKTKNFAKESSELHSRLKSCEPAAEISKYALSGKDHLAELALHYFTQIYGAQTGNLALTILATGGVYIAGGIAPKIMDKLKDGTFIDAFNDNPKMKAILKNMPVHVILDTTVGLNGARSIASTLSI
ncbi:MAG: glucokinase [Gammaproteobacteria bacterium]